METVDAWWFSASGGALGFSDGRSASVGVTHEHIGEPVLCQSGLHASADVLDALQYAPGPQLWRVQLSGVIVRGDDKLVATRREYLWHAGEGNDLLRAFARRCALDVIHLWDAPDIVVRYLQTGDELLRAAARAAASDAARAAARGAASDAASDAARAAAWDAAGAAAWAAAWAAARAAAWDAAGAAAWAAARAAAWAAAWDAAWDAHRQKQVRRLVAMAAASRTTNPGQTAKGICTLRTALSRGLRSGFPGGGQRGR